MSVRQVTPSAVRVTGVVPSGGNSFVEYESLLERDFYLLLSFDPQIKSVSGQPLVIEYYDDQGKLRHYTPDALVTYKDARIPCLFEVKPLEMLRKKRDEIARTLIAGANYAREHKWKFRVVTESFIRTPRFSNLSFLRAFQDHKSNPEIRQKILKVLRDLNPNTQPISLQTWLNAIERTDVPQGQAITELWVLIAKLVVTIDLDQPFSMASRVSVPR